MWVNKVPNVHVWADHTSVKLLLGTFQLLPVTWLLTGTVEQEAMGKLARLAQKSSFLSFCKVVLQRWLASRGLGLRLNLMYTFGGSLPLCQTDVVTRENTAGAVPTSHLSSCGADIGTHLHSKSSHLRCASLPTVLFSVVCLSLFVCKVLYITWIYYAHILPNG